VRTYTLDEVKTQALGYFKGDELAANVWISKYCLTSPEGQFLEASPNDMHRRLAKEFARIEAKYPNPMGADEIYGLIENYRYIIPQGSPMAGIGNPFQIQSISNCFVLESPFDSYGGILTTDQQLVQIAKRRGGIGFDISTIRPKGMTTENAARTTDGIEIFMDRYSASCREVAQNGRRGALMLTLSVHHPQIRDFIKIKRDKKRVTGANISIRLTDEFMVAVESRSKFMLRFPVDAVEPEYVEWIDAADLWDEIIESAHNSAEPGLLFWDNVIKFSPADIYAKDGFRTISTNPCGELPLCALDSCRLLLLNLLSFVMNPFTPDAYFDHALFATMVQKAQRLMDDMIDLELEQIDKILAKIDRDPEPVWVKQVERDMWVEIRRKAQLGRRTGLGVTAVGDALAALGLRYGSDESIKMTEVFYRELAVNAYKSSCTMGQERGTFGVFDWTREKEHPFIKRLCEADPELTQMMPLGRRNIALTTTAPAGTVSTQTMTTSGIEPAYLLNYKRRKKLTTVDGSVTPDFIDPSGDRWIEFDVFHHGFAEWMRITGNTPSDVEKSPYWKATSADVDWRAKIKMQAAAQRWICHAISNTTNLPEDTPIDVTKDVYMLGWKTGCKGVTIYREGSRTGVLVKKDEEKREVVSNTPAFIIHDAPKRPEILPCDIHRVNIKGEAWTVLVGLLDGKPYELLGGLSKYVEIPKKHVTGQIQKRSWKAKNATYDLLMGEGEDELRIKDVVSAFDNPNHAAFTRVLSLSLRHGAPVNYIVEQLQKGDKDADLFSFAKVIGRVLKTYIQDGTKPGGAKDCPDCGAKNALKYSDGCVACTNCGSSKCG
jgi:ribonucleoside-diphosphate reductase alpha chain